MSEQFTPAEEKNRNARRVRDPQGRRGLFAGLGWPYQTSLAMARLVFSGVFDKYPNIKFLILSAKDFKNMHVTFSNEINVTKMEKPVTEQKEILEKTFEEWKGNGEQTDDVTVIGIRI